MNPEDVLGHEVDLSNNKNSSNNLVVLGMVHHFTDPSLKVDTHLPDLPSLIGQGKGVGRVTLGTIGSGVLTTEMEQPSLPREETGFPPGRRVCHLTEEMDFLQIEENFLLVGEEESLWVEVEEKVMLEVVVMVEECHHLHLRRPRLFWRKCYLGKHLTLSTRIFLGIEW